MRKSLSILIAVLLSVFFLGDAAFVQAQGFRANPGTGDVLGQGKYQSDAHRIFRMVRYVPATYSGATTLAADSIVIWDLSSDDGVTVTTTTTSSDTAVAGIIVAEALTPDTDGNTAAQDAGRVNWTWLQTYGLSQVDFSTQTGVVAGDAFGTGTTAGEAVGFVSNSNNPRAQGIAGFAYDAAAGGDNDVQVFLRLD